MELLTSYFKSQVPSCSHQANNFTMSWIGYQEAVDKQNLISSLEHG